jgi:hypothetical protein
MHACSYVDNQMSQNGCEAEWSGFITRLRLLLLRVIAIIGLFTGTSPHLWRFSLCFSARQLQLAGRHRTRDRSDSLSSGFSTI